MVQNLVDLINDHRGLTSAGVALFASLLLIHWVIPKITKKGFVAQDVYKPGKVMVPTMGGVTILMTALYSIAILSFIFELDSDNYLILFVVTLFALYGMLDDLLDMGRARNLIIPIFLSIPLIHLTDWTDIHIPLYGELELGFLFYIFIIVYVMVVANLINLHSGFNGLAIGTSTMILATLLLKTKAQRGDTSEIVFLGCMMGATLGFLWYNKYPAKIFEGNVGSFAIGASIGVLIVTQGFYISGIVMFIPHIFALIMEVFIYLRKIPRENFGHIRKDGTIEVPNGYRPKFILPYRFRMTEKQALLVMWGLTGIFCFTGYFIAY